MIFLYLASFFLGAQPFVLFLDDLFSDMTLVLKIFVLMSIVSYVVQHLGKGPLALLIISVMAWFIIFDYFYIFGGAYVLYMLAILGGTSFLIDLSFFVPQLFGMGGHGGGEGVGEHTTGKEFQERQRHLMEMRRRAGIG